MMTSTVRAYVTEQRAPCYNLATLAKLPAYDLPAMYRLSDSEGAGCMMDPPGFPSHFIRSIYTRNGDNPNKGPSSVLVEPGTGILRALPEYTGDGSTHAATLRRLWAPLPLDHERTVMWIRHVFGYFRSGWLPLGTTGDASRNVADLTFYPKVDNLEDLRRAVAALDVRELAAHAHDQLLGKAGPDTLPLRTLRRYRPIDYVIGFYPDADPEHLATYANVWSYGAGGGVGDWYETHARAPSAEECPGLTGKAGGSPWSSMTHERNMQIREHNGKTSRGWCQFCGAVNEPPVKAAS
jgi:hypothetical protein